MNKILVTGGAGYIGSVLTRLLLSEGHSVVVLDSLKFGGESLVDLLNNPNFSFVKGDVRHTADLKKALDTGVDAVVHLAAIVGDPACAQEPEVAQQTNLDASKDLYALANEYGVKRFVFASTCSNYGRMADPEAYVHEDSELAPVSLYAETKVAFEQHILNGDRNNVCKPTSLRFSTVYGLSQRPRFDLTVNEFTKDLVQGKELLVFGEQFWRPYCHVEDLARSVLYVLDADVDKVAFEVFNVGDTSENYQKLGIIQEIQKQVEDTQVRYVEKKEDPRNYWVSFEKIKDTLGYKISKKVPDGIAQIIKVIEDGIIADPDDPKFKNVN